MLSSGSAVYPYSISLKHITKHNVIRNADGSVRSGVVELRQHDTNLNVRCWLLRVIFQTQSAEYI